MSLMNDKLYFCLKRSTTKPLCVHDELWRTKNYVGKTAYHIFYLLYLIPNPLYFISLTSSTSHTIEKQEQKHKSKL